jgi:hypothetical protein
VWNPDAARPYRAERAATEKFVDYFSTRGICRPFLPGALSRRGEGAKGIAALHKGNTAKPITEKSIFTYF